MGHAIEYFTTDKRSEIMNIARDFAMYNVDRQENPSGSYHGRMTIHDDIICDSYDDAVKKIEALDNGWYDDHAVKYKAKESLPPNKAMLEIKKRIEKNREDCREYEKQHSVKNRKAEFVSCPYCLSKLRRFNLRGERCPVCGKELRAKYILERIGKYDQDWVELNDKYNEIEKNRKEKCPIRWVFKVEVHC